MQSQNFKFGTVRDEQDTNAQRFSFPNLWDIEKTSEPARLIIAPESGHIDLIIELSRALPEPFGILYVLVVPRGGNEEGRYQSDAPAGRPAMEPFLSEFRDFFEKDARHHIWIFSLPGRAMLVYDNHNVIYAYGELEKFKEVLDAKGFTQGGVNLPVPHVHLYNPTFDSEETRILSSAGWKKFPLLESDY